MAETKDSFVGVANGVPFFRARRSENAVRVPPAYIITDERGDTWTIGWRHDQRMEWDIVRNGQSTGEFASCIEMAAGVVRILSAGRWKRWVPAKHPGGGTFI